MTNSNSIKVMFDRNVCCFWERAKTLFIALEQLWCTWFFAEPRYSHVLSTKAR